MNSNTQSVTIECRPSDAVAFIGEAQNLPRWAIAFAKGVRRDGDSWTVVTQSGELIGIDIVCDKDAGTVDFRMEPAPGVEAWAYARVLPNEPHTEVLFTQFQQPGQSDEIFAQLVASVGHEFAALKAQLEVECPL
jgi:hypothetical protein